MSMPKEYDVVTLKQRTPAIPLPPGTRGTILIAHAAEPPAYEIEFVDDAGASLGTYTAQGAGLNLDP
ncbi:DUF4926 domain-containing protein [Bradyrhizobium sp. Pa8]|uniref:DUF4926 domain-containing protein n=1 Tax=Bradyrhizobium sp. Pa8 TaxID=3386552 RepID=UPI00403F1326